MPFLHSTRVEPAFGDHYAVCSCGAYSLPMSTEADAEAWKCPRAEAEVDVFQARLAFERIAHAHHREIVTPVDAREGAHA